MVAIATTFITSLSILGLVSSLQLSFARWLWTYTNEVVVQGCACHVEFSFAEAFLYCSKFDIWFQVASASKKGWAVTNSDCTSSSCSWAHQCRPPLPGCQVCFRSLSSSSESLACIMNEVSSFMICCLQINKVIWRIDQRLCVEFVWNLG